MVGETFVPKSALTKRLKVGARGIYVPLPLPRRKRHVVGQLVLEQITSATTGHVEMCDKQSMKPCKRVAPHICPTLGPLAPASP